ncbi:MAG: cobalt-precorrin-6A reductase [Amaricoccus sp.]
MHVLVLGGTGEAREIAGALAARPGLRITLSLAGRTRDPALAPCAVRTGGFGGPAGLAEWMFAQGVGALIDATHPFASVISANARTAAARAGVPLVVLDRLRWEPVPGDRWTPVPDVAAAVAALGREPRRVFLAIGRQEVAAFRAAPQHRYLVRSIEPVPPDDLPPLAETLLARGPFSEADEAMLLSAHRIEILVAKNSGGDATFGKLGAARRLGLPVVMLDRQPRPDAAPTVAAALERFDHLAASAIDRGV